VLAFLPLKAGEIVREIERDRVRGATALAERALQALALSRAVGPALKKARPGMPFMDAVVRLALQKGVAAARRDLQSRLSRLLVRTRDILPPGARYIVFGSSGTVQAVLREVGAKVVEEVPADVGLVGADALLPDGDFVNVEGTSDFLRRVRRARAGVFVVATELKRVGKAPPLDPGFERVPARLVHAILTETGLHYPPMGTLAGVDPTWLDRGALNPGGGEGKCHPHHASRS
jgi:translation initiation factor 2B subunit (eIF-2B alpha/beta/delta family)